MNGPDRITERTNIAWRIEMHYLKRRVLSEPHQCDSSKHTIRPWRKLIEDCQISFILCRLTSSRLLDPSSGRFFWIHKQANLDNRVPCFMTAKRRNDRLTMGLHWLWRPMESRVIVEAFVISHLLRICTLTTHQDEDPANPA